MASKEVDPKKACHQDCWTCDVEKVKHLPKGIMKSIAVQCTSFEDELLALSRLLPLSDDYFWLKEILFCFLTFDKEDFCAKNNNIGNTYLDDKFHAVVAGSYPAKKRKVCETIW